jgi:hypothetical protein
LYEQLCPNPQPLKPAKDKKHNREKKRRNERKKNPPLAHIMHAPKSHPIEVTKDLIECMITGFNQKHFQKQLPNITARKELNRSVSRSWPTNKPTKTVKHHKTTTFRPRTCRSYFTKLQEH